jgi:threonyl-tRNA synthetase
VADLAATISPRLAKVALAATVDDRLVDLSFGLDRDARVRIVTADAPEALALYRHSTAHLLAAAVTQLFPGTQCGIGPATDDGFFYDFVVERPFVPEDLERIEAKMRELAEADLPYERQMWPRDEALAFFASRGEPLKCQLIDEKTAGEPPCRATRSRTATCSSTSASGPTCRRRPGSRPSSCCRRPTPTGRATRRTSRCSASTARRSSRTRTSRQHLTRLEEAKKRDHRRLGRDLGLFTFHPWAPGATFWLDKGTTLYHLLADYMRGVLFPAGYVELKTPLVFNKALWETSGHWQHYRQNMFLVESENEQMGVKAMNCPGHMLVFASAVRSYRDLPLRFHEQTPLHRNEASGVLSGLTRVRQFAQDDAHCFVMESQIGEEVERLLRLVQRVYADFDLTPDMKLSTRPAEFLGEVATWDHAEAELRRALDAGEPALHGQRGRRRVLRPEDRLRRHRRHRPQVAVRDDPARLPAARALRPEVRRRRQPRASAGRHSPGDLRQLRAVHRAAHRALRRRVPAVARAGAGGRAADCRSTRRVRPGRWTASSRRPGLRVETDARQEKVNYKIREAQLQKVPYMLVVGDREAAEGTVAVRSRAGGDLGSRALSEFVAAAREEIRTKGLSRA